MVERGAYDVTETEPYVSEVGYQIYIVWSLVVLGVIGAIVGQMFGPSR